MLTFKFYICTIVLSDCESRPGHCQVGPIRVQRVATRHVLSSHLTIANPWASPLHGLFGLLWRIAVSHYPLELVIGLDPDTQANGRNVHVHSNVSSQPQHPSSHGSNTSPRKMTLCVQPARLRVTSHSHTGLVWSDLPDCTLARLLPR